MNEQPGGRLNLRLLKRSRNRRDNGSSTLVFKVQQFHVYPAFVALSFHLPTHDEDQRSPSKYW